MARKVTIVSDSEGRVISVKRGEGPASTGANNETTETTNEQTLRESGTRNAAKLVTKPVEYVKSEYERKRRSSNIPSSQSVEAVASAADGGVIVRSQFTNVAIRARTAAEDGQERQYTPINSDSYVPATILDQAIANQKVGVASRTDKETEFVGFSGERYRKAKFSGEYVSIEPLQNNEPAVKEVASTASSTILQDISGAQREKKKPGSVTYVPIREVVYDDSFARSVDNFTAKEASLLGIRDRLTNSYKRVPFLGGDSYSQKAIREVGALPYDFTIGFGIQNAVAVQKTYLLGRGLIANQNATLNESKRAATQVPTVVLETFNPSNPAFTANMIGTIIGARAIAKASRSSPAGDFVGKSVEVPTFKKFTSTFGDPSKAPNMLLPEVSVLRGFESSRGVGRLVGKKYNVEYFIEPDGGFIKVAKSGKSQFIDVGGVGKNGKITITSAEYSGNKLISLTQRSSRIKKLFNEFDIELQTQSKTSSVQINDFTINQVAFAESTGFKQVGDRAVRVNVQQIRSVQQRSTPLRARFDTEVLQNQANTYRYLTPDSSGFAYLEDGITQVSGKSRGRRRSESQRMQQRLVLDEAAQLYPTGSLKTKNVFQDFLGIDANKRVYQYTTGRLDDIGVYSQIQELRNVQYEITAINKPRRQLSLPRMGRKAQASVPQVIVDIVPLKSQSRLSSPSKLIAEQRLEVDTVRVPKLREITETSTRVRQPVGVRSRTRVSSVLGLGQRNIVPDQERVIQTPSLKIASQSVQLPKVRVNIRQIPELRVAQVVLPVTRGIPSTNPLIGGRIPRPPTPNPLRPPVSIPPIFGSGSGAGSLNRNKRVNFGYTKSFLGILGKKPKNYSNVYASATGLGIRF